ncbi:hypothetical protein BSKO_06422 [Bryopsis sp. KO-2023]|nr:hypothetical protein BSKO_06422 [Bryopsis sp. KO-2023]
MIGIIGFVHSSLGKTREFLSKDVDLLGAAFAKAGVVAQSVLDLIVAVPWTSANVLSIIAAAIAVVISTWAMWPRRYDLDRIPGPWKHGMPVLGNVLEILTPSFHRVMLKWANKYGGVYRMKVLWRDILIISDPREVARIVGRGEGGQDKSADLYLPINQMVEPNAHPNLLTSSSDNKWKTIRKAVAVSFSHGNIKKKYPMVLGKINELLDRLRALGPEESVDVDQAALRVTLDVVGLAAFGHDFEAVKQDHPEPSHMLRVLPRCFTEVELRMANPLRTLFPSFLFKRGTKGKKSFETFHKDMTSLLKKIIARGDPKDDDQSVAAQLMRIRGKEGIVDERLLSEIGILFVEGFETTGHTIGWTLFSIVTNEGIQEKVANELDNHGLLSKPGYKPREIEYEDLRKLRYLNSCIKEAMRMLPVVSVANGRVTKRVSKIGPYTVPPDTMIVMPLYCLHNSDKNWPKASKFLPSRWDDVAAETFVYDSRGSGESVEKGVTFMPFSDGPRNCVGQSLAKMEVIALLAKMLGTFRFEMDPAYGGAEGVRQRESTHLTLQTQGTKGIRMFLTPRDTL